MASRPSLRRTVARLLRRIAGAGLVAASAAGAADLTATEQRWLQGAWPVVQYAREQQLPLDIVVQPQPAPGLAPLASAFVGGRCKLVLSMRGNAEAEATLRRIDPALLDAALELMAAHELAHCRRHLEGVWHGVPAGFVAPDDAALTPELRERYRDMQATRREEGYADLVGLAWIQQRHGPLYARLHAWLLAERTKERVPGSHHDTLAWLQLARDGIDGAERSPVFAVALPLWQQGLALDP